MSGETIVTALARFCRELRFEKLPVEVVAKVKELILDQVGVELACSVLPWNEGLYDYVREMGARGPCRIVGHSLKTNVEYAVLANATFGHGFETDDYNMGHGPVGHPGALTVPVALALSQTRPVSGKRMIEAVVAGYEIMAAIARGVQPSSHYSRGFHAQSSGGTFATAAVAGVILEPEVATLANAFSIAASHSCGIMEYANTGGSVKRLHCGIAAVGGVRSVMLAQRGWTGPPTAIEGNRGFCQAFASEYHIDAITQGLGERYSIMYTNLKPYSCNGSVIPAIDAFRAVLAETPLKPGDIAEIIVHHSARGQKSCGEIGPQPEDVVGAQFSVNFSLGMALMKGRNDVDAYATVDLRDAEIVDVARKVRMVTDAKADDEIAHGRVYAGVTVLTRDGRKLTKYSQAKGTPANPMSREEVGAKFRALALPILTPKKVEALLEQCERLELCDDVSTIAANMAKSR